LPPLLASSDSDTIINKEQLACNNDIIFVIDNDFTTTPANIVSLDEDFFFLLDLVIKSSSSDASAY
jgi:hypothetical protein